MHWGNEIIDLADVEEMNRKVENMTVKEIRSFITAGHAFLIYGDDHWAILNQIPSELNNNNTNMDNNENITFEIQGGGSMTIPVERITSVGYEKEEHFILDYCKCKPFIEVGEFRIYVAASELVKAAKVYAEYLAGKFNK